MRADALPAPLEREVQGAVVDLLRQTGWKVRNLSQGYRPGGRRHGTTRQSKGLPDLICIHRAKGILLCWETKRPGATRTPEQEEFASDVACTPAEYGWGGVPELCAKLRDLGFLILRGAP